MFASGGVLSANSSFDADIRCKHFTTTIVLLHCFRIEAEAVPLNRGHTNTSAVRSCVRVLAALWSDNNYWIESFFSPHSSLKEVQRNNDVGVCFNFNCELKNWTNHFPTKSHLKSVETIAKSELSGLCIRERWNLVDLGPESIGKVMMKINQWDTSRKFVSFAIIRGMLMVEQKAKYKRGKNQCSFVPNVKSHFM